MRHYQFDTAIECDREVKQTVISVMAHKEARLMDPIGVQRDNQDVYIAREERLLRQKFSDRLSHFVKVSMTQDDCTGDYVLVGALHMPYVADAKIKEQQAEIYYLDERRRRLFGQRQNLQKEIHHLRKINKLTLFVLKLVDPVKANEFMKE